MCPVYYSNVPGDVPGWGSIRSLPSIKDVASCASHCDLTSGCCSFEFSTTEMICNLNRECKPTRTANYKDYAFCVKGKGRLHEEEKTFRQALSPWGHPCTDLLVFSVSVYIHVLEKLRPLAVSQVFLLVHVGRGAQIRSSSQFSLGWKSKLLRLDTFPRTPF